MSTSADLDLTPWTVDCRLIIVDDPSSKVRCATLRYRGVKQMSLKGPTSERSLQEIANKWNASRVRPVPHKKAAADLTPAKRTEMHLTDIGSTGEKFDETQAPQIYES